jgi:monoterpene epsilon-lactone hydrolase
MSREQRAKIDAMLRQSQPEGPPTVEAIRVRFAALMATMIVPDQLRTTPVTLGARPAQLVVPAHRPRPRTIQ